MQSQYLFLLMAGLLAVLSVKLVNYGLWNINYGPQDWRATAAIIAACPFFVLAFWLFFFRVLGITS